MIKSSRNVFNNSKAGLLSTKAGSVCSVPNNTGIMGDTTRSRRTQSYTKFNMISADTDEYVHPKDLQHLVNYRMEEEQMANGY